MPLPGVGHGTKQCSARSKRSGTRCNNPAVVTWGLTPTVCRMHGARTKASIKQGRDHIGWKHGRETLEAKAKRSRMSALLLSIEDQMFTLGMVVPGSTRTRGRKPKKPSGHWANGTLDMEP